MADKTAGVLTSATSVLRRAVELDKGGRLEEAVTCYQEGLNLLMDVLRACPADKKEAIRAKVKEYMGRAEELKKKVEEEKEASKYHEQISIENDSTGHSYPQLFGKYLKDDLTEVTVEDPYIRSRHQVFNFLRFCEMLVKSARNLRSIKLITGHDEGSSQQREQKESLQELGGSLKSYNITLDIVYDHNLHDREIRFNNGWIIKIGRGLDIYKATNGKFVLGFCDFDLRKCHATTVDIFHNKHLNKSYSSSVS